MIIYDNEHLAWWERSKKGVLENRGHDWRVCIMYANFKAQHDGVLDSGFIFFSRVELIESGPVHRKIFSMLLPREQTQGGADTGHRRAGQDREGARRPRQGDRVIAPARPRQAGEV